MIGDAKKERVRLLNTNTFIKKYVEVLVKFAVEISEAKERPDADEVMPRLDADCRALLAVYPGGLKGFMRDFHLYAGVMQQLRGQLIGYGLENIIEHISDTAPENADVIRADVEKSLNEMLGFK